MQALQEYTDVYLIRTICIGYYEQDELMIGTICILYSISCILNKVGIF